MTPPTMLTTPHKSSTDGASSPDQLTGQTVRLWPYVPGVYGRDALYRVWKLMEEDDATKRAFWDESDPETGADLASFMRMFSGIERILLMIESCETGQLCGCFWINHLAYGHQAFVGMWMQMAQRGSQTMEAARLALTYTFDVGACRQLWALTPWPGAGALCRAMGFERMASLPEFCLWQGQYKPVTIYRLRKERFNGIDL